MIRSVSSHHRWRLTCRFYRRACTVSAPSQVPRRASSWGKLQTDRQSSASSNRDVYKTMPATVTTDKWLQRQLRLSFTIHRMPNRSCWHIRGIFATMRYINWHLHLITRLCRSRHVVSGYMTLRILICESEKKFPSRLVNILLSLCWAVYIVSRLNVPRRLAVVSRNQ